MTKPPLNQRLLFDVIDDISFLRYVANELKQGYFTTEEVAPIEELEQQSIELLKHLFELQNETKRVNVAVVGGFSSGKSTFINSLLGANICPVGVGATTSSITTFLTLTDFV